MQACVVAKGNLFLFVTTYEKKNGFLLIETYKKHFNPQNDGHLDQLWVAIFLFIRVRKNYAFL